MNALDDKDDDIAHLIRILLDYCDHKPSCEKREDLSKECTCGLEAAVNEAIKIGNAETTTAARWINNGSWYEQNKKRRDGQVQDVKDV